MITLTAEQAQQIEEALKKTIAGCKAMGWTTVAQEQALAAIREQKAEMEKQRDGAVAQKCFGAGAAWPEQTVMKKAAYELSKWLSAALDDPKVCEEYKNAINGWYDAAMPFLPTKTGKLHRNVLLQVLGGLLAGEYSLDAHSLDMYPSKNDDLQQIYDAIGAVKRELEGMAAPVQQAEQEPVDGVLPCPFCGDNQPTVFEGSTFRWRVAVCNNCGAYAPEVRHDTLAEDQKQAGIESDAAAITAWNTRAAPVEPVQQEPVAWLADGQLFYTKDVASIEPLIPLYTRPARTKDLTDDEIEKAVENILFDENFDINIARAVIAADREKNK